MSFKVGDKVQWRSQSAGSWAVKRGEIVEVVPSGTCSEHAPKGSSLRDHESYLVRTYEVERWNGTKNEVKIYWPGVSALERVEP